MPVCVWYGSGLWGCEPSPWLVGLTMTIMFPDVTLFILYLDRRMVVFIQNNNNLLQTATSAPPPPPHRYNSRRRY